LVVQWAAAVVLARHATRPTSAGGAVAAGSLFGAALAVGGVVACLPLALALARPGRAVTRHAMAVGQVIMVGILVRLGGARAEAHVHAFGALALLALYRDWLVLLTASAVMVLDHSVPSVFGPRLVFPAGGGSPWPWLVHVGWVAFEDLVLILGYFRSRRELRVMARRQVDAADRLVLAEREAGQQSTLREALERQRFLEGIAEATPAMLYLVDIESMRFVWVNGRTSAVLGYSPEELRALGADGLLGLTHADDAVRLGMDSVSAVRARYDQMADGTVAESECRVRHADGSWRWVNTRALIFRRDARGRPTQVVGALLDVTERKKAEDTLRALFENTPASHILLDEGEGIIDCNTAALKMFRCRDKSEMLGIHPARFAPTHQPDGRPSYVQRLVFDATARREGVCRFDWWIRCFDGTVLPVHVTLTPVDIAGRSLLLAVAFDLSVRMRAEQTVRQSEQTFRLWPTASL
jgi:PAS domain S-box-containing protein